MYRLHMRIIHTPSSRIIPGSGGAVPDGVRLLTAPGVVVGNALSLSLSARTLSIACVLFVMSR